MNVYTVVLKTGEKLIVEAERVDEGNGMIRFISSRKSYPQNYIYGPIIHASFNKDDVSYYTSMVKRVGEAIMKCYYSNEIQVSKSVLEWYEKYAGRTIYTAIGIEKVINQMRQAYGDAARKVLNSFAEIFVKAFENIKKTVMDTWKGIVHSLRVQAAEASLAYRTKRFQQIRQMSPRIVPVIDRRPMRVFARSNC
ncbi:hypothetical protein ACI2JA_15595 [Alkalihalobacillus sp. NPDC078783]